MTREVVEHPGAVLLWRWTTTATSRWFISTATPMVGGLGTGPRGCSTSLGSHLISRPPKELRVEYCKPAPGRCRLGHRAVGFSDESCGSIGHRLREVGRPEAHHEEADMMMGWYPIAEAARRVLGV